jgi:predicted peptidase
MKAPELRRLGMRFFKIASLVCGLFLLTGANNKEGPAMAQKAEVFETTVTLKYLLYLPDGYGQKGKKWPLILFLHGAGERGDNLELVKAHGPPKLIKQGRKFEFIIVSPQCSLKQWWPGKEETLLALLDDIESKYDVDKDRVYLTGLSMGGFASWDLGCFHPERFAAIAPICGGGDKLFAKGAKDVPIWAFHGAKDPVVPLERSQEMVDAINAAGGNAKLTVYPEAGHDSWTQTYENPELYKWFLSHRISDRKKITQ